MKTKEEYNNELFEINGSLMYNELIEAFNGRGDAVAISYMGKQITANKLFEEINLWANILTDLYGVNQGDTIAMNLPNIPNAIILFYAINKCGAIANLFHPYLPPQTVVKSMNDTKCRLFITLDSYYDKNIEIIKESFCGDFIVSRVSDYLPSIKKLLYRGKKAVIKDTKCLYMDILKQNRHLKGNSYSSSRYNNEAVYMHSAGTSGEAKTIILSNVAIVSLSESLTYIIPNMDAKHNKCIMVLPLFHGFGFGVCMHAMLAHGFEVVLIPKFKPEYLAKVVCKRRATICAGIPTMFSRLLTLSKRKFRKLKYLEHIFCGGDKLGVPLKESFNNRLKEIGSTAELVEGYGLTETVTVCCINKKGEKDITSMGFPLKCVKLKIINEEGQVLDLNQKGEICIGGPTLMEGYLGDDASAFIYIDGEKFVKTGDIGFLDKNQKLHFLDRKKRMFKIQGIAVFPSEIERIIKSDCEIKDCVVTYLNRNIVVFIENDTIDENKKINIVCACKNKLLPYSVPQIENIIFLNKFPKTVVGKIDVKKMEADYLTKI